MPITFGVISMPNPRSKKSIHSQINQETLYENINSKGNTIKILLDSCASTSIVHKDRLYERHRILKGKTNEWSTMAEIFNTTFVTETI